MTGETVLVILTAIALVWLTDQFVERQPFYGERLTSTLRDGDAWLRARVAACRSAANSACRNCSRSSSSSRNRASRSASISVKILSRTSARGKRLEVKLIFAL